MLLAIKWETHTKFSENHDMIQMLGITIILGETNYLLLSGAKGMHSM